MVMRADGKAVIWLNGYAHDGGCYVTLSLETASKYGDSWEYDGWTWDEVE